MPSTNPYCNVCPGPPFVDPNSGLLFIPGTNTTQMLGVSNATLRLLAFIPVGERLTGGTWDVGAGALIALSTAWGIETLEGPYGGGQGHVTWIDAANWSVVRRVALTEAPIVAVVDPVNRELYVVVDPWVPGLKCCGSVEVFSLANGSLLDNLPLPGEGLPGIAYDPVDGDVFAEAASCPCGLYGPSDTVYLTAINTTTDRVAYNATLGTVPDAQWNAIGGVGVDPLSGTVFVASPAGGATVAAFDPVRETNRANISVGTEPTTPVWNSSTREMWVANAGSNNVSVINTTMLRTTATIAVGGAPDGVAFDLANGYAFVSDWGNDSVSIIRAASALSIRAVSVTTGPIYSGYPTNISVTASGGDPPLHYNYAGLPSGCVSADVPRLSCTPTEVGMFRVTVRVTDVFGHTASNETLLEVTVPPCPPINGPCPGPRQSSPPSAPNVALTLVIGAVTGGVIAIVAYAEYRRR